MIDLGKSALSPAPLPTGRGKANERMSCLDIARGVSIVLVVVFHASITLDHLGALNPQIWLVSDFFGSIRMPVFFAISGFLGRRILDAGWPILLRQRVLLLTYLYALWTALDLLANAALGRPTGFALWFETLAWPNPVLWFIWALAAYFIVAKFCKKHLRGLALLGTLCATIAVVLHPPPAQSPEHLKAIAYAFFFLAGAYCAPGVVRIVTLWRVALCISFALYTTIFFAERWSYIPPFYQVILPVLGVVAGLSGARLLDRVPLVNTVLAYLGRNTLTIYLAHTQFLKLLAPICASIVTWPGFRTWAIMVAVPAAIALSLAIRPLVEALGGRWLYALPATIRLPFKFQAHKLAPSANKAEA